jgi:hypothetical protein
MTEIKPKKQSKFERKYSFGRWVKTDQGYKWRVETQLERFDKTFHSWEKDGQPIVTLLSPESQGLTKNARVDILFLHEVSSQDDFEQTVKTWQKVTYEYAVKPDQGANIWLKKSKDASSIGRLYLLSIDPDYCCSIEVSLYEGTENYSLKKGKPVKISPAEAMELSKTTKYIFSKQINGEFVTTV